MFQGAQDANQAFGLTLSVPTSKWNPVTGEYGGLTAIYGTLVIVVLAAV